MASDPDDLEAVRTLVGTLEPFDPETQVRIIRWACEKLKITIPVAHSGAIGTSSISRDSQSATDQQPDVPSDAQVRHQGIRTKDIKTFISEKEPSSNNEFAACVAYYYRFEAPEISTKDAIDGDDLLEACRLAGRTRLQKPSKTLNNAHSTGLLDKTDERGKFTISTVGENLVAMTLPSNGTAKKAMSAAARKRSKAKTSKKQPAMKKVKKKK